MSGTLVKLWKQDPSVESIGVRTLFFPEEIERGPSDRDIVVKSSLIVESDEEGNFLFDPIKNEIEFDAVHTFAVVRLVLNMYRRAIKRCDLGIDLSWQWGDQAITVHLNNVPRNIEQTRYDRATKSLNFNLIEAIEGGNKYVYTCRSLDIVAHETGHAILDSLRPHWYESTKAEFKAFHESFADITAILTILSQMDLCESIIAITGGDLHDSSFLPEGAEELGLAFGQKYGFRNSDENLKLSQVKNRTNAHELSKVFTSAFYDILVDIYKVYQDEKRFDQAETLFRTGKHMTDLLLRSIISSSSSGKNRIFKEIAENMIKCEEDKSWQEKKVEERKEEESWKVIIWKHFYDREILGIMNKAIPLKLVRNLKRVM